MALEFVPALRALADQSALRLAVDRPFADAAARPVIGVETAAAAERGARIVGRNFELGAATGAAAAMTK
jgi:hypothetical protein